MRRSSVVIGTVAAALVGIGSVVASTAPTGASSTARTLRATAVAASQRPYFLYWDQNEQEDFLASTSGQLGQLIPPRNANGQMCLLPDHSGRFVTGYNPTLAGNPGSTTPAMQPPVGEALWNRNGSFSGQTIYVPGPYTLPGQTVGGDIPPDSASNTFNNNGTFTGCAFGHRGNLFATDLGTAQGDFPPPDSGRLIEWFAPSYSTYCILYGPTAGGVGPHHVDGTGGLTQPGDLAVERNGDLLLPEAGTVQTGAFNGSVLRFGHTSFPRSAADCGPDGIYPRKNLRYTRFIEGSLGLLPFPQAIAHDPVCECWAVASTIGDPAIAWFDELGHQVKSMGVVPGESLAHLGDPNGYNPFGLAIAPDGTVYFVDIHIQCTAPLVNCGPADNAGRIMKVTFTNGKPDPPVAVAGGYNFPTSVTVCVPDWYVCPQPAS